MTNVPKSQMIKEINRLFVLDSPFARLLTLSCIELALNDLEL